MLDNVFTVGKLEDIGGRFSAPSFRQPKKAHVRVHRVRSIEPFFYPPPKPKAKSKSKQQSEYTAGLRKRLDGINEISEDFMKAFGEFSEKKLPKDDLYYSIKNEMEAKEKELDKKKKKQ